MVGGGEAGGGAGERLGGSVAGEVHGNLCGDGKFLPADVINSAAELFLEMHAGDKQLELELFGLLEDAKDGSPDAEFGAGAGDDGDVGFGHGCVLWFVPVS